MDQGTQRLIRRHNAQMRDLIVRDIDALEQKLNVKRQVSDMADSAVDTVKGKLGMNNSNPNEGWLDFVRHNAAPLAAVGLGGAVLAKNLQSRVGHADSSSASSRTGGQYFDPTTQHSSGIREQVGSKLSGATGTAADGFSSAKEQVSETTQVVGEKAIEAKDAVLERIPSRDQVQVVARDHSQVVGVAALAVGALAGVLTPRTKAEERRLAPMQSQMRDKASDLADQGIEMAKDKVELATDAISSGVETVKEELDGGGEQSQQDDSTVSGTDLPDLTRPNRITGSRVETLDGVPGSSS
jgi:gas vesicle protein